MSPVTLARPYRSGIGANRLLDYNTSTDVFVGAAISTNTPVDLCANQSFTVSRRQSLTMLTLRCTAFVLSSPAAPGNTVTSLLIVDGTEYSMGSDLTIPSGYGNTQSCGPLFLNLAPGSHTVKAQLVSSAAGSAYLRSSSWPNFEYSRIQVTELYVPRRLLGGGWKEASPVIRLAYRRSTNLSISLTQNTWMDLCTDQTFRVGSKQSLILIGVRGGQYASLPAGASPSNIGGAILLDGTTRYKLGGALISSSATQIGYINPYAGGSMIGLTGLSPGTHTVRLQVFSYAPSSSALCNAAGSSRNYFQYIDVVEIPYG